MFTVHRSPLPPWRFAGMPGLASTSRSASGRSSAFWSRLVTDVLRKTVNCSVIVVPDVPPVHVRSISPSRSVMPSARSSGTAADVLHIKEVVATWEVASATGPLVEHPSARIGASHVALWTHRANDIRPPRPYALRASGRLAWG